MYHHGTRDERYEYVELYNPAPMAVELSNVYLSDDRNDLLAYKIPDGIVLQPGEFWAVSDGTPPGGFGFALDSTGETIYVTVATDDAVPVPVRVLDAVRYGTVIGLFQCSDFGHSRSTKQPAVCW